MAKTDNAGQAKLHKVAQVDTNGQIIPGSETEISQTQWQMRDKTATPRLVRLNADGTVDTDAIDEPAEGTVQ